MVVFLREAAKHVTLAFFGVDSWFYFLTEENGRKPQAN